MAADLSSGGVGRVRHVLAVVLCTTVDYVGEVGNECLCQRPPYEVDLVL